MGSELSRHICCPSCGYRGSYRLADGRKKCRRCGKKYSCRLLKSRLPAKILKRLALLFWLRAPVTIAARELRLDPKTVRRHYNLIRQGIVRTEGDSAQTSEDSALLSLLIGSGCEDRVVVSTAASPLSEAEQLSGCDWKYGAIIHCQSPLTDIFCRVYLAETATQQGVPNWLKKLDKLARIARGLSRRTTSRHGQNRQMLLNEVAFRFNHRSDPGASAVLYDFFKSRPETPVAVRLQKDFSEVITNDWDEAGGFCTPATTKSRPLCS